MKNGSKYPILMDELKKILKRKKIKYSDLAKETGMSESSIKRLMSAHQGNLSRIEELCLVAGIDFFDLVSFCQEKKQTEYKINAVQEKFFSKNTSYFYFLVYLFENNKSVAELKTDLKLNNKTINQYLKKLEELDLLERHPGDKIVWKIQGSSIAVDHESKLARYLMNISLKNFYELMSDLDNLKKQGNKKSAYFQMGELYLKPETAELFNKKIEDINNEMAIHSERELKIYGHRELVKYSIVQGSLPLSLYFEEIPNL